LYLTTLAPGAWKRASTDLRASVAGLADLGSSVDRTAVEDGVLEALPKDG
jgi:hypothetical protein